MSKIARLFVHRLEQLARREARRNALCNGLLDVKAIEIDGHMTRRYTPVFDTSSLTGDRKKDLAWVRRHFGGYLQPSMVSEAAATLAPVFVWAAGIANGRLHLFLDALRNRGRVRDLDDALAPFEAEPLRETARVAGEVRRRLAVSGMQARNPAG